jgi:hypothetical protein
MEKPHYADKTVKISAIVIAIVLASIMFACIETNLHSTIRPVPEVIQVTNQGITVIDGNYNISYSIKAQQSTTIDKILVNPRNITGTSSNTEVNKPAIFVNGIKVDMAKPLGYNLDSGNILQVNAIIPCAQVLSNEASITVVSLEPYCYYYAITMLA